MRKQPLIIVNYDNSIIHSAYNKYCGFSLKSLFSGMLLYNAASFYPLHS